tara:strand:- start:656 stop:1159 length:504 start_codon:yes stop_codon:yes gene_type:complete
MQKISNIIFGLGFIIFNVGLILATYYNFGFDIVLVGGISSVIGIGFLLSRTNYKDFKTLLIHLIVLCFIAAITLFTNNLPFDKSFRIAGSLLAVILLFRQLSTGSFNALLEHPFLNHNLTKIAIALFIISKVSIILKLDFTFQIYNLVSVTLIAWAFLKFVKPQAQI